MADVMFGEQQLVHGEARIEKAQFSLQQVLQEQLLAQPDRHRHPKRIETTRGISQIGLKQALESAAEEIQLSLDEIFSKTDLFIYGTTRATNAIVTGNIAKTAFITTAGFPDVLVLREGGKFDPHEFSKPYPKPYVPRRHTFEVEERIESTGKIYHPLNEKQARGMIGRIKSEKFDACAVSLLWATSNPVHEKRLGELIREQLPGIPYTLSHELNPILREYRRASSVSIDIAINFVDSTYALMVIPTMVSTFLLAPKVMKEARRYFSTL